MTRHFEWRDFNLAKTAIPGSSGISVGAETVDGMSGAHERPAPVKRSARQAEASYGCDHLAPIQMVRGRVLVAHKARFDWDFRPLGRRPSADPPGMAEPDRAT
jgi:hypothetical protein